MRSEWAPILALALLGCDTRQAKYDRWCEDYAARTSVRDYVDQRSGRIERDPTTNEIVDPDTGEVAITSAQERCIARELQKTIDAYEAG